MEGYGFCAEFTHDVVRILCILHFFRMSRQLQEVETSLRISWREDLSLGSIFPWLRGADESIRRRRSACRRSCDVLPCCSGPRTPLLKAVDWSGRAGRYQQSLWEFQGRRRLSSSSTPHRRPRRRAREPRGSGALAIAVFHREREAHIPVLTSCGMLANLSWIDAYNFARVNPGQASAALLLAWPLFVAFAAVLVVLSPVIFPGAMLASYLLGAHERAGHREAQAQGEHRRGRDLRRDVP